MFRPNLFRYLLLMTLLPAVLHPVQAGNHPQGYWQAPGMHIPHSQNQAPILDYYSGNKPRLIDPGQPFERALAEVAKRSWIRFEFLHWSLDGPDRGAIGAPILNQTDPLQVFDNSNGGIATGVGIIPSINQLGLNDTSGVRGTWGLDLAAADFELEFFGTQDKSDAFGFNDLSAFRVAGTESLGTVDRPNVVIPLLTDGGIADASTANFLVFDSSFSSEIESRLWGAEATLLTKPYIPGNGFQWQWLGGFRYLSYDESFRSTGAFNNGGLQADVVTQISADSTNNLYGPEVGGRAQINNKWFTLSATPRIAFALNNYTGSTFFNGTETGQENDVDFTPIVQVSFKGEVHVSPNLSLYGGYDFMWIYRLTRPFDNIVYDSTPGLGGAFTPDIRQAIDLESFASQGLTFGAVLRY
ncbi:MAG: BBP7 family outer membrane beta-barrel protein [Fuerstiella sp.]